MDNDGEYIRSQGFPTLSLGRHVNEDTNKCQLGQTLQYLIDTKEKLFKWKYEEYGVFGLHLSHTQMLIVALN